MNVTLRKWFHLFWTTLLLGMVVSTGIGLILQFSDKEFSVMGLSAVGFNVLILLFGSAISVLSQMGFFAYLIVRFIMMGIIRSKTVWDLLQLALVIFALFELIFLRVTYFEGSGTILSYSVLPAIILILSLAVAYWKVKLTNRKAFIPTLFFMIVASVLEAVPALRLDDVTWSLFMLAPLFACNAWQILILHKILDKKKS